MGHWLLRAALVVQAAGIGVLVYQIKNIGDVLSRIDTAQYERFAIWMLQQESVPQAQINQIPAQQLYQMSNTWVQQNGAQLHLSLNANPVELAALITAFSGTLFVVLFSFKTAKLREALPSADKLDGLMYKLAGVAFAGLALLLMTGDVWEWLTYAGFLHSRIAYGWKGRHSAYFAIIAFLFVVFTYLGVSYLLPGLHSYA
jgi:ABC-type uncharacterized transport system permease subunit